MLEKPAFDKALERSRELIGEPCFFSFSRVRALIALLVVWSSNKNETCPMFNLRIFFRVTRDLTPQFIQLLIFYAHVWSRRVLNSFI
jgi:hypothetical protein